MEISVGWHCGRSVKIRIPVKMGAHWENWEETSQEKRLRCIQTLVELCLFLSPVESHGKVEFYLLEPLVGA